MSVESKISAAKTVVQLSVVAAVGFVAYKGYAFFQSLKTNPAAHPAIAGTLQSWGILPPGPDGRIQVINPNSIDWAASGAAKLAADAGPHTQYAYNQALSKFALAHGFPNGTTAANSYSWPYNPDPAIVGDLGFNDWQTKLFPDLTTIS